MTTPLAPEADRYLLPMPESTTPVISEHLVIARHAHLNSSFGDMVWPLAPLIDNPSQMLATIDWHTCQAVFRPELRLITWTFLNGELRNTFVRERGIMLRSRISPDRMQDTVRVWLRLADWLLERGIGTLAACDRTVLHEYGLHLRDAGTSRGNVMGKLMALTRLWAFDQLTALPAGIARPPWDEAGLDDYLPAATSTGGENAREVLGEETMGPLLVWAIRFVEDLADDILAAHTEGRRLHQAAPAQKGTPAGRIALNTYLNRLTAAGTALPSTHQNGKPALARNYIAGMTGASLHQVQHVWERDNLAARVASDQGPCPLDVPLTGRINDRPWRESIDFNETTDLLKQLVTATFIVCSYLTGARTQEILGLRSGCCPDPEPGTSEAAGRHVLRVRPEDVVADTDDEEYEEEEPHHLIRGHHYKTAIDPDTGHYLPGGTERPLPWVAITPVVKAIRVLERIVPEGALLFDAAIHCPSRVTQQGSSLRRKRLAAWIEDFAVWVNTEAQARGGEVIPPDPHGKIGTARFRRTLAWHIARRPGGLVALAIQYGHMRTVLNTDQSGRYGSRGRDGIHSMVNVETALATADTAADLHERMQAGEAISGPAARRAILAAANGPVFQGGLVGLDFVRKHAAARRYLARDGSVLYDNPHALLLCLYKRDQALCAKEGQHDAPSLDQCVPGCGNTVRTDQHATWLRQRADDLDSKAAHVPGPLAARRQATATRLRELANEHDRTRFTLKESPA
ncbi:integrase [Kitasatospora purpeofusca]|uniref:integrase n=1 Tax=Kitasatospora purpeofusca TaxID=67352 RepID=UPI00224DF705|nr:integrase [Kitasatospora purpeofusca]MCX4757845.1 integrase [Kitasatospora purpeofusca]WSR34462.1 integrase [Kitasatospora purpeofusca]